MQHDEFLGAVQQRARLATLNQAERAARATLETLAERLAGGAAENLAAQLDPVTARYMRGVRQADPALSLDDFIARVRDREGDVTEPEALHHARAVLAALQEAVSEGAVEHVLDQLPEEFDALFESGSEGRMRPVRR